MPVLLRPLHLTRAVQHASASALPLHMACTSAPHSSLSGSNCLDPDPAAQFLRFPPPVVTLCSYVSGSYYARNEGKAWIQTMLLTAGTFPVSCFAIAFVLNTIAIFYQVCVCACVCFSTVKTACAFSSICI